MTHSREGGDVVAVGLALVVALLCSTMLRNVTAELNDTVGTMWPFSLAHCLTSTAPGCEPRNAGLPSR